MSDRRDFDIVISHGPGCADGFCSAYVFWTTLSEEYRMKLSKLEGVFSYIPPINHKEPSSLSIEDRMAEIDEYDNEDYKNPIFLDNITAISKKYPIVIAFAQPSNKFPFDIVNDKNVLMMDIGMKIIPTLVARSKSFTLMDHHKTTNKIIKRISKEHSHKFNCIYDSSRDESGVSLAWKYFYPDEPIPELLNYVRISDTNSWHEDKDAHNIIKALYNRRVFKNFYLLDWYVKNLSTIKKKLVKEGKIITMNNTIQINDMAKYAYLTNLTVGDRIYTVSLVYAPILHADVAKMSRYLCKKKYNVSVDFCVTWKYVETEDRILCSLRSPTNRVKLEGVADYFGGGGHKGACTFSIIGFEKLHEVFKRIKK